MSTENIHRNYKHKRHPILSVEQYVDGILAGNTNILSQAITLIESSNSSYHELGQEIIDKCLPYSGNSIRVGITGVPGVGKSTFINSLGKLIASSGNKLAILAIDPSSKRSKGSILGDKTRMESLISNPLVFIRPSPSSGSLGGVTKVTRESIILCEAAGYEIIFVETVGVGQSETAVYDMVDFFLLLMLAGAGDELQGIKRGIMEMTHLLLINKADGNNLNKAKAACIEYSNALHLFPANDSGWTAKAEICSAESGFNMDKIWNIIQQYKNQAINSGYWQLNRDKQAKSWMQQTIQDGLLNLFNSNKELKNMIFLLEKEISLQKISPYAAAKKILGAFGSIHLKNNI